MPLTEEMQGHSSPVFRLLRHKAPSITDGSLTTLISGKVGKRIRIWMLTTSCVAGNKSCKLLSGTDEFPPLCAQSHELRACGGIPVFTCNEGDDFKGDPSDTTNWYFYIVYTID